MGAKAQAQDPGVVPESDLLKAIGQLEEAADLQKGETEPVPRGYMDSTKSARGGAAQVLESGPGSTENLIPDGHGDKTNFDMGAAQGPRAEMGKGQKSDEDGVRKDLEQRPTVKKAMEVSQFLEELVDGVADSIDNLRKSYVDGTSQQSGFNQRLAKAIVEIGNEVIQLRKSVTDYGNEPASERKSVLTKSELEGRDFGGEGGNDHHQGAGATQIQKSDVLSHLCDRAEKGEIPTEVVTEYELTNDLPPNIAADVRQHFGAAA